MCKTNTKAHDASVKHSRAPLSLLEADSVSQQDKLYFSHITVKKPKAAGLWKLLVDDWNN